MSKLEKSEQIISNIIAALAPNGVMPIHIVPSEEPFNRFELNEFVAAMTWLINEEIIHVNIARSSSYRSCTLSSKGYALLGQRLKLDDGEVRLIDAVEKVNSGQAVYANAGNFVGGLLAAFTKSIG